MACCTTISPVSSPKKRGASSMFELPRSTKRRRGGAPLGTTMITTINSGNANVMPMTSGSVSSFINFGAHSSSSSSSHSQASCFDINVPFTNTYGDDDSSSSSDSDDIMNRIRKEAKRILKRKQQQQQNQQLQQQQLHQQHLDTNNNASKSLLLNPDSNNGLKTIKSESSSVLVSSPHSSQQLLSNSVKRKEVPLFTMSQVNAICEKMVKEREAAIREQYDKILAQKLSEQYDAFVKFTHEQIQRRFEDSHFSYVS